MTFYDKKLSKIGVSHVCATAKAQVGELRREGGITYVYAHNAGTSVIYPGYGMVPCDAMTTYSGTVSSTTQVDFCIGSCRHVTAATADYFWAVKEGPTNIEMHADASCVTGELLVLGANGVFSPKSISTGWVAPAQAVAATSIASGTSGKAFVKF